MNKYPFTSSGLQSLLLFLYGLPDPALKDEADALALDFRAWMMLHFEFSATQILYLEQMEDVLAEYFGTVCGFYIAARWPIALIKDEQGAAAAEKSGAAERSSDPPVWKIVRSEDVLNPDAARSTGGSPNVTGTLTIEITYIS